MNDKISHDCGHPLMTLRDYFAAHAPISSFFDVKISPVCDFGIASKTAYEWADAMMNERMKHENL